MRVALVTMMLIAAVFLGSKLWHSRGPVVDYTGEGGQQVLIEVHEGDFTTAIAETMLGAGVIANVKTFLDAAQGNAAIAAIQPASTGCGPRSLPLPRYSSSPTRRTGWASW